MEAQAPADPGRSVYLIPLRQDPRCERRRCSPRDSLPAEQAREEVPLRFRDYPKVGLRPIRKTYKPCFTCVQHARCMPFITKVEVSRKGLWKRANPNCPALAAPGGRDPFSVPAHR
jgi:hypothetical protein